jgi:hypothetical protein
MDVEVSIHVKMRRLSKQRSCFYQDTDSVPTQTSLSDVESDIDEDEQRPQRQRSNSETDLADIATDLFLAQSCVYLLRHPSVINFYRHVRSILWTSADVSYPAYLISIFIYCQITF